MFALPQISRLLEESSIGIHFGSFSRPLIVRVLRFMVDQLRHLLLSNKLEFRTKEESIEWISSNFLAYAERERTGKLRRVLNATGVVINTNLGRSPLPERALKRMLDVGRGYANLEIELATRKRGGRMEGIRTLMCELSGAESAYVVNNNAAAVMLALSTMAAGQEVVISRGELVEIGGSFRIPDVMRAAGVILKEVGTTNRTHLRDYENAINERTGLLLKVHPSNYAISGFTSEVALSELVDLGVKHQLPVMIDLGSGSLLNFQKAGVKFSSFPGAQTHEPTIQEITQTGVDIVTCSGDKLLGGPQSGILLGRKVWIDAAAHQPLTRALRVDKLTLAALEATLQIYVEEGPEATQHIPIWTQLTASLDLLQARGEALMKKASEYVPLTLSLEQAQAAVGGGALPTALLPTVRLVIQHPNIPVEALERHLRMRTLPILGLLDRRRLVLDLRTLHPDEFPLVESALQELAKLV